MAVDARQYAPATQRNRDSILNILLQVLPPSGTVLEVSSGTGEHAVFLSSCLPHHWLPSDPNPVARASIAAWRDHCPTDHLHAPIYLDAMDPTWVDDLGQVADDLAEPIVAIANINMIHIAPWSACLGLLAGASRILPPEGILYLYGPYKQNGLHTAESNAAFDQGLRSQNPDWGVRDLEAVVETAQKHQFSLMQTIEMPANNLSVIFQRRSSDST